MWSKPLSGVGGEVQADSAEVFDSQETDLFDFPPDITETNNMFRIQQKMTTQLNSDERSLIRQALSRMEALAGT